jgi:class 3 adenylate cyclase
MYLLFYTFIYYNIDSIINKLYISNLSNEICSQDDLITNNNEFYYSIININLFTLFMYSIYIIKTLIYYNSINTNSLAFSLIYIKYTITCLLSNNTTLCQYETSRNLMWVFTTPLMLKLYCDANNITLYDINIQYHIIPTLINLFVCPYKGTILYYYSIAVSWVFLSIFIRTLYLKRNMLFTNMYLFIWTIFICITIIDMLQIISIYNVNMFFLLADIISKITINIIINEYNEREVMQVNNMDLQSIQFVSYMIKNIKVYKNDNVITTSRCSDFIDYTTKCFLLKIPENKTILEQELLKKILPLGFDKEYYRYENENENANVNSNANSNANAKQFTMISILFTDIVNYTELAKKYDDKIIFDLLNDVYNKFDNIIKKYSHLQKIETIGDAYMVVGDIYRDTFNHKIVIKEIILFALELIKEIKLIKTPDKLPLSIRIGINMGQVSIGILGSEIPRLCVVGNAVNVAARLQSTADPNTIQMSRHIYEQIDELDFDMKFETKFKENVFLKNIGSVNTYNIHP